MIRKLNKEDNSALMRLILEEPEFNLYIIGDIENFGYDQDFLEFFGELNEQGEISAVLVRYFDAFVLYAKGVFDAEGFKEVMRTYGKAEMLSGKTEILSKFPTEALGLNCNEFHHFAVLKEINPSFKTEASYTVKKANIEDIDPIVNLKESIDEFANGSKKFKEILLHDLKSGTVHGYYIEMEGNMVAYAQTSAENSKSAMVVSVMTSKEHRKKGLASACIKVLCEDLVKQGKTLCLFYKNPEAGSIYKRIGFKDIGLWSMYIKS